MSSIHDPMQFRNELEAFINRYPELFPNKIKAGYRLKEMRVSKKTGIPMRRILADGVSYTIRPTFVMPYHMAFSADADNAMFLRKFDVPFWGLHHVFGKDAMYWYRLEEKGLQFFYRVLTLKALSHLVNVSGKR